MASYKQKCIHCGTLIERDAHFCPVCASASPFGYQCPTCLRSVQKGQAVCDGCGRQLYIICPHCGQRTFADVRCEHCFNPLTVQCSNKRCGAMQFFENKTCTQCGKKIKNKIQPVGQKK